LRCGPGLAGLTTLRQALASRSAFTPHVTLLYDRQSVPEACIDEPITWTVRDFVLVQTCRGRAGICTAADTASASGMLRY
jgi:2'-5' RNA ligase